MIFKIKQYILLGIAFVYSVFRGKANKPILTPEKIIVVQMAKLGDMVCSTPVFRAIKQKYPGCKVYVMGNKINKGLLEGNEDVDEYIVFKGFWSATKKIKKEKIDFGCVSTPDFIGLAALYLTGIPLISAPTIEGGFSPWYTRVYKLLIKLVVKKPHRMGSYAPREYLRLLEPINIFTEDTKKHLAFSKEADTKINEFLTKNGISRGEDFIVGISPSAGNEIKQWPPERFAELANYISEKYSGKIMIIGGPNDGAETGEMIKHLNKGVFFLNAQGLFNIDELKALISKLNLFISVDTGPIYIAEAFGIPTIDIIGPMDEREQPPIGKTHRVVKIENRKKPELHIMNARVYDYEEARRQVDEISVEMIRKEIDYLTRIL